jgi:hypothetical protein
VFFLTAILAAPAILALARIRMSDVERAKHTRAGTATVTAWRVLRDRRLLIFAGCILLFKLANAAMLPPYGQHPDHALERVGVNPDLPRL